MRRRNIKNASEKIKQFACLINPEELLNLQELFKNDNPVHLELGMGKGNFIIEMAKRNPNINYLGIEKFESVILQALKKKDNEHLDNLVMICADGENLLKFLPPASIAKIYLNFSDPWPKARHEKRRLTSNSFLKIYDELLINFDLEFKTDNRELFEYSLMNFNQNGFKFLELHLDLHQEVSGLVETEYEARFKNDKPIYFVRITK